MSAAAANLFAWQLRWCAGLYSSIM
jgi:hypothetical protein